MERRSTKGSQSGSCFGAETQAMRQPEAVPRAFCSWDAGCKSKGGPKDEEFTRKYTNHAMVSPFQSLELLGVILAKQRHVHINSHGQVP